MFPLAHAQSLTSRSLNPFLLRSCCIVVGFETVSTNALLHCDTFSYLPLSLVVLSYRILICCDNTKVRLYFFCVSQSLLEADNDSESVTAIQILLFLNFTLLLCVHRFRISDSPCREIEFVISMQHNRYWELIIIELISFLKICLQP
jgi:hypothetical protein